MSISYRKCCVPGCLDSGGSHKTLHIFPHPERDRERFNTWVYSIGGNILGLTNQDIYNNRRVCHAHFEEKFCCRFNRISNVAVPTLHLPGSSSLPRFTFDESRPAKYVQDYSTPEPLQSTSTSVQDPWTERCPLKAIENLPNIAPSLSKGEVSKRASDSSLSSTSAGSHPLLDIDLGHSDSSPQANTKSHVATLEENKQRVEETLTRQSKKETKGVTFRCKRKSKCVALSFREEALYKKLVNVNLKLSRCRNQIKRQKKLLNSAKSLTENKDFLKVMENFTSAAKILTLMQFREHKKSAKGRRFNDKEKVVALSILKTSPKAYRFLRLIYKIFPSPETLIKFVRNCNITAGINKKIFKQLQQKANKLKQTEDKLCILIFDEMSIAAHINYNERRDCINGWVNNGQNKTPEFADHAQVFMIRGLVRNYKQPVSYTFASAATKGPELAKQIKEIIKNVQNAGFQVVATVCDQGTNNVQAIKLLVDETKGNLLRKGIEPRDNIITINDKDIIPLYDAPHMLKCLRNNFLEKNIKFLQDGECKIAKWEHVQKLADLPAYKGIKLISKLTVDHVEKSRIPKMKVKYASQVFSRTVGTNMGFLAVHGVLPEEAKNTADLLLLIDDLFDSLNGRHNNKKRHGKPLLGPVTPNSDHHKLWDKAKQCFKDMKFVDRNGKASTIPTLKNWVWTLDNIELLLKNLNKNYNVTSIWTRHLNQDPLENFFGSIRSHGCRNNNPTASNFESAFSSLLINNMSSFHTPRANCEEDLCPALFNLLKPEDCEAIVEAPENYNDMDFSVEPTENRNDPQILAALHYVSGYFIKKVKRQVFKNCYECSSVLISTEEDNLIKYREYAGKRWLISPSEEFVRSFSEMQDIIHTIIKKNVTKNNIREFTKTIILMFVNFDYITCKYHKDVLIDKLINMIVTFFLHKFCKRINKILKGAEKADIDNEIEMKAKKYCSKCIKRKK